MFLRMVLLAVLPLLGFYLYEKARHSRFQQFAAWPQLKPSLVWGHLKAFNKFIATADPSRHIDIVLQEIRRHLGNPPLFLLDLRPIQRPLVIVCSHEVAEQVSKSTKELPYSVPKSPTIKALEPLLGPNSILSAHGEQWRSLRKRFNPGFAPQHLMSLMPCILDKAWRFLENLDRHALDGNEFSLDEPCVNLTFDIIGAVTMDEDFCAQLGQDKQTELVRRFRELTLNFRTVTSNQWFTLNPRTIIHRWWLSRRIDTILSDHIRAKFAELKAQSTAGAKSRSVLSLSLQNLDRLDNRIVAQTRDQLKSFLFAGHDTTSILLQWAFYELSRTPRALAAIRAELDDIFGADSSPAVVREMLLSSQREGLVRRMSYTSAVIKETLRLYPPSGSARHLPYGSGFTVALPGGGSLCLDGTVIYNCSTVIQRDEGVYGPTAAEFRPERWLGDTDTSMQTNVDAKEDAGRIPASAWRPFERGPRNCIGQELANLEARVILACTVRRYDFEKVGLGAITRDSTGLPVVASNGQYEVKNEVFNTMQVTAKPIDGMKVKVRLVPGAAPLLA